MSHSDPAAPSALAAGETLHAPTAPAAEAAAPLHSDVVTHHWVNDAEWGDIEEIVVYGDAA